MENQDPDINMLDAERLKAEIAALQGAKRQHHIDYLRLSGVSSDQWQHFAPATIPLVLINSENKDQDVGIHPGMQAKLTLDPGIEIYVRKEKYELIDNLGRMFLSGDFEWRCSTVENLINTFI